MAEAFARLGFPLSLSVELGIIELVCLALYVIPRTSILGAILLTGYLGGAVATHLRVGDPLFDTIFPILIGALVWGGPYLARLSRSAPSSPFRTATVRKRNNSTHKENHYTMRFMMLMIPKGYEQAAPGTMPDPKAVAAMMKYNESLQKAGVLLALDGLHPPSVGARVSFAGGKPKVTDGPFVEAKEVIGGYWMIQVKSREEAMNGPRAARLRTTK